MNRLFIWIAFVQASFQLSQHHYERLNGPIVGILSLPTSRKDETFNQHSFSMIPGSYVKWLEQAGIRIIPIRYDLPKPVIKHLMQRINGILITGGSSSLFHTKTRACKFKRLLNAKAYCPSPYLRTVKFIVKQAVRNSNEGRPFPLWGTCLGFEAILTSLSRFSLKRKMIESVNHSLNLQLNKDHSDFFEAYFDEELRNKLAEEPLIYFNHKFGYYSSQIENNRYLKDQIDILATTTLENNEEIVSMIKHKTYPFIGVQFHPEKVQFEHRSSVETNVTFNSIEISHRLAMIFFDQVAVNTNESLNEKQLEALLIYNYPLFKSSGPYEQIYVFPKVFELKFNAKKNRILI